MVRALLKKVWPFPLSASTRPVGEAPALVDLDVQTVSASKWWIGDNRLAESDPRSFIGFIEKKNGRFDAMRIGAGSGLAWVSFPSMPEAVAHFTEPFPTLADTVSDFVHSQSGARA